MFNLLKFTKPSYNTALPATLNVTFVPLFIFYSQNLSLNEIIEMKDKDCPVKQVYDPEILRDLLPLYYKRLFPHQPFYRWLSYGNGMCKESEL